MVYIDTNYKDMLAKHGIDVGLNIRGDIAGIVKAEGLSFFIMVLI